MIGPGSDKKLPDLESQAFHSLEILSCLEWIALSRDLFYVKHNIFLFSSQIPLFRKDKGAAWFVSNSFGHNYNFNYEE